MTSKQNKISVDVRLSAICVALLFTQGLTRASEVRSTQNGHSPESRVVLEIALRCTGMCGIERGMRLRLFEDATAECIASKSGGFEPGKDEIILKKSAHLTKEEYDQFINLAESPQFLKSAMDYDSKLDFVDSVMLTDVVYTNNGKFKQIFLKNYLPSVGRSTNEPPDEVRHLVERAYELFDKIRKSGT